MAISLICGAFCLRSWRRNGVACDEIIFFPGSLHAQKSDKNTSTAIENLPLNLRNVKSEDNDERDSQDGGHNIGLNRHTPIPVIENNLSLRSNESEEDASHHLFQCTDAALGDALLKTDPSIVDKPVSEVLEAMKNLAVIPVATGILRAELLEMKQLRDEAYRKFASRVRGKAETCNYKMVVECQCRVRTDVDFTDHILRDVLLAGIYQPSDEKCMALTKSLRSQSTMLSPWLKRKKWLVMLTRLHRLSLCHL